MPVKFDFENVKDSVTVSLLDTLTKKTELKNDSCVTINSTEYNLSKYDNVIGDYLNSATTLGPIPIEPEKIEIKNMELEGLIACVEMLIERVTALNEENIQLKDRVSVLEALSTVTTVAFGKN